jgi:hypothetical protein
MPGSLGTLVLELAANTARLQSDMGRAVGLVESGIGKMTRLAKGLAGGAFVAGITSAATRAIQFGDDLNKAAVKAGVGAKAISELAYAAKMSDIDLNALSTSLRKMQVALSEAATGAKGPNEALAALGLRIEDIKGLKADQQFEIIADRISRLRDPADRARAAVDLFGKAGADLLPLFEQGAAGIRKAREEAQKMGQSFSEKQVKALAEADDAVKRLKASWEGFFAMLTAKGAPALAGVLDLLRGDLTNVAPGLDYANKQIKGLFGGEGPSRLDTLREEIRVMEESLKPRKQNETFFSMGAAGGVPDVEAGIYSIEERIKKLGELRRKLNILTGPGRGAGRYLMPGTYGYEDEQAADTDDGLSEVVVRGKKVGQELANAHNDMLYEMYLDTRTFAQREVAEYENKLSELAQVRDAGVIDEEEYRKRLADIQQEYDARQLSNVEVTARRVGTSFMESVASLSEYAKQAARNTQDALAEFLFDPFDGNLKNMLRNFLNVIRRMEAEAAAAKFFDSRESGGFGLGNLLGTGLNYLLGGGRSGGGSGPMVDDSYDDPRYSNSIAISSPVSIDMRGASVDAVQEMRKQLPSILDARDARLIEGIRRGKYQIGPA